MKVPIPKLGSCLFNAAIAFAVMIVTLEIVHFALVCAELIEPRSFAGACETITVPAPTQLRSAEPFPTQPTETR